MIVAGIDEAGYGPLLGPLVISACILRVPEAWDPQGRDLWKRLSDCVVKPRKAPSRKKPRRDRRILIGDSKVVYSPATGTDALERAALALTGWAARCSVCNPEQLAAALLSDACQEAFSHPWQSSDVGRFPLTSGLQVPVVPLQPRAAELRPMFLGSRVLSAAMLNRRYQQTPNKAVVAWSVVAGLLGKAWDAADDEFISVVVDRQGGRTHYGGVLQEAFPQAVVRTLHEAGHESSYRVQRDGRIMEVTFWVGGDNRSWPVAVASLISKYWREVAMARLNDFFARRGSEARGTAGYYNDAQRWLAETESLRGELGITDAEFVRER